MEVVPVAVEVVPVAVEVVPIAVEVVPVAVKVVPIAVVGVVPCSIVCVSAEEKSARAPADSSEFHIGVGPLK